MQNKFFIININNQWVVNEKLIFEDNCFKDYCISLGNDSPEGALRFSYKELNQFLVNVKTFTNHSINSFKIFEVYGFEVDIRDVPIRDITDIDNFIRRNYREVPKGSGLNIQITVVSNRPDYVGNISLYTSVYRPKDLYRVFKKELKTSNVFRIFFKIV